MTQKASFKKFVPMNKRSQVEGLTDDSGHLGLRNLPQGVTANDLRKLFSKFGEIDRVTENCAALTTLQAKMAEAKERAEGLNGEEELLGQPRSVFDQLEAVPRILAPYVSLWMICQDFKKQHYMWLNGPMSAIDPEQLESDVGNLRRENIKNYKFFENDDSGSLRQPLKVAEVLKEEIEVFRAKLPLVACICNKGMRDRHWKDVSEIILSLIHI